MDRDKINRDYRNADIERWQSMDFVIGYKIHRSNNCDCECELCKAGAGEYPKSFNWNGWHNGCKCFLTSISVSVEEMAKVTESVLIGKSYTPKGNTIEAIPQSLIDYVALHPECKNEYWYLDNKEYFK